ncbi:hypothetical protein GCM10009527_024860 [Actinomadura nitritigenes]
MQTGKRQVVAGTLQRHVGGVVRAGEERRPGGGQAPDALGEDGADGVVVARLPVRHAARERDQVEGDVGMVVGAQLAEALVAEGAEAQRGALRAVGEDAEMLHDRSSPLWRTTVH